jgi:hypothetical protein
VRIQEGRVEVANDPRLETLVASSHPKGLLRHHRHIAELTEVVVEGTRCNYFQPLHDDLANAVRKAPIFIAKTGKDLPGTIDIPRRNILKLTAFSSQQWSADHECDFRIAPHFQKGKKLIDDVIRRKQAVWNLGEPLYRRQMVDVIGHVPGKPDSSVNEDHLAEP